MKILRNVVFVLLFGFGLTAFAQSYIFPDVKSTDWFYTYVNEIKDWGIVSGNDDGTFAPARNINRAEFSKMLVLYDERVDAKISQVTPVVTATPTPVPTVVETSANLPSVMRLESSNAGSEPAACPEGWESIDVQRVWNLNSDNLVRTCLTDQRCEVLSLQSRTNPASCPDGWSEASFGTVNFKNSERVCYVCE